MSAYRVKLVRPPARSVRRRLAACRARPMATALAHAGLGLAVIGIVATTALAVRGDPSAQARRHGRDRRLHARLQGCRRPSGAELPRAGALFEVSRNGDRGDRATPSKRVHRRAERHDRGRHSCELARRSLCRAGRPLKDGAFSIRLYFNPLVRLIWLGALVMFIGGAVSLSDRRLRVGAPRRAQAKAAAVSAAE